MTNGSHICVLITLLVACLCMQAESAVQLDKLRLLPGWNVQLVTDQVPSARKMAVSKDFTYLFLGSATDKVYAVPLEYNIGANTVKQAGPVKFVATGQVYPHGIVYDDTTHDVYFSAGYSSIYRVKDIVKNIDNPPAPELITNQLPSTQLNGVKTLRFDHNQSRIYFAQGVPCDTCLVNTTISPPSYYGMIMSIKKDGSDLRVHATGVRNSVGMVFHPTIPNQLWFSDTSDKQFYEELNVIMDVTTNYNGDQVPNYGYPFCHGHDENNPEFFNGTCLNRYQPAKYDLAERITVLGIAFNRGAGLPRNAVLCAEKGSVGYTPRENGYRITYVDTDNPQDNYKIFADGWLLGNTSQDSWGRPVDVRLMSDDSILVSDEKAGAVYRFYYTGSNDASSRMVSFSMICLTLLIIVLFL